METRKVKKVSFPHTFVIIFVMIVIAVGLTWVVPAGTYDFVKSASGRKVVDPATFHYIQSASVNPLLIPLYIIKSFSKRIDLMMVIFMAGSAFHVVTKTGALQAILAKGAKRFSNRLEVFIPVLTLIFGLICTTQGVNTFIPFAPVMVMLAMAMGLDSITGEAIMVLGGAIGFSTGTFNMFTTVVAQDIAELPAYSGLWYRAVCFVVFYIVTNWYLIRYAKKIKKNPTMSPMFDLDQEMKAEEATMDLEAASELTGRMLAPLVLLVIAFAVIIYGAIVLKWGMAHMAAMFLTYSVVADLMIGTPVNTVCKDILDGSKQMLGAAFIIGMATAISGIMDAGKITYTIVHATSELLSGLPPIIIAPGMVLANTLINLFLTSGSGQAVAVMPILIPLADVLCVTRQTTVLAFNFGDGFCNFILPTSTALMGTLSVTNIPYDRWMRFMWKLFLIWLVTGCVMTLIAQMIHLGPM
ncbi:YfcC family protein [Acidaminococcus sp. BV3L6]|uniref:YfcC family protein n=1 Tax=Acidaminococcus sp. (strain BV3L6) TaxID=1111120 RepID=UPI0003AD8DEA|nr:Na+/H+ antiporter NhaC family protein [Acidaminococcus sp. BV3L6]ERL16106.1 C4-dicarboxylate anaerobic carrier [Acidaminococcus sp. BV3L6]